VFECMALNADYQWVSEHRIIKSTTGIIANVRHDHVEQLGSALLQIARSLSSTDPQGRPLYTAETNPEVVNVLTKEIKAVDEEILRTSSDSITDDDIKGFHPLAYKTNIAHSLEVSMAHGVGKEVALEAMRKTARGPGASKIHCHERNDQKLWWANFFGVNDVASAEINIDKILIGWAMM